MSFLKTILISIALTSGSLLTQSFASAIAEPQDGFIILSDGPQAQGQPLKDYVDLEGIIFPPGPYSPANESIDAVVELALVCDKEWGDLFGHDQQKMRDYWIPFMNDMELRYKTMPSVNISFRVTSLTFIESLEDQPFIEKSRNEQGEISWGTTLRNFGDWIGEKWDNGTIPKYDIAMLAFNTRTDNRGIAGMAYLSQACSKNRGVGIWWDDALLSSVIVAAHEIGHVLGANHDHDLPWCNQRGYIMADEHKRYFFSNCSDIQISDYARSERGSCLGRIDGPRDDEQLPLPPGFTGVVPPSMEEQCQIRRGNPNATVPRQEKVKCWNVMCWSGNIGIHIHPITNTPCIPDLEKDEEGICFRSRCIPKGSLLVNVGSGECLLPESRFAGTDNAIMGPCPSTPTALDTFFTLERSYGTFIAVPYSSADASENQDKCLWTDVPEGFELGLYNCERGHIPSYGWDLRPVGNEREFMIVQWKGTRDVCAKQEGGKIRSYSDCNESDPMSRWTFQ